MSRTKQILIVVMAVTLLFLGVFLPFVVTAVQDAIKQNAVQYGNLQSLELVLQEDQEPLDMLTKLLLLQHGDGLEIMPAAESTERAEYSRTEEEMLAMANNALSEYVNSGLVLWDPETVTVEQATPFFVYMPEDPTVNATLWMLRLITNDGIQGNMILDEETGKLLSLEYYAPGYGDWMKQPDEYMSIAEIVYFESLGVVPSILDESYYDNGGLTRYYYLEKAGYENVTVHITLSPDGFLIIVGAI